MLDVPMQRLPDAILAFVAAFVLASCGGSEAQTVTAPHSTSSGPTEIAPGALIDLRAQIISRSDIDVSKCEDNDNAISVQISDAIYDIPADIFGSALLSKFEAKLNPTTQEMDLAPLDADAFCRGNPQKILSAVIQGAGAAPVMLREAGPTNRKALQTAQLARIREMGGDQRSGEFLVFAGTEGGRMPVVFILPYEPAPPLATGAPLYIRCADPLERCAGRNEIGPAQRVEVVYHASGVPHTVEALRRDIEAATDLISSFTRR